MCAAGAPSSATPNGTVASPTPTSTSTLTPTVTNSPTATATATAAYNGPDVFRGKPVTSSGYWPCDHDGCYHDWRAVDGDDTTLFGGNPWGPNSWLRVDVGYSVLLGWVRVRHGAGHHPTQFRIDGSSDDTNWTTLVTASGVPLTQVVAVNSQTAYRYYRLYKLADADYWDVYSFEGYTGTAPTVTPTNTPTPPGVGQDLFIGKPIATSVGVDSASLPQLLDGSDNTPTTFNFAGAWAAWDMGTATTINSVHNHGEQDNNAWRLDGSNDLTSWSVIARLPANGTISFAPVTYRYYRLYHVANGAAWEFNILGYNDATIPTPTPGGISQDLFTGKPIASSVGVDSVSLPQLLDGLDNTPTTFNVAGAWAAWDMGAPTAVNTVWEHGEGNNGTWRLDGSNDLNAWSTVTTLLNNGSNTVFATVTYRYYRLYRLDSGAAWEFSIFGYYNPNPPTSTNTATPPNTPTSTPTGTPDPNGTDLFAGKPCMPGQCVGEGSPNNATDGDYSTFMWSYGGGGVGYDTGTEHHLTDLVVTSGTFDVNHMCWAQWSDLHLLGSDNGNNWTPLADWSDVPGCVSTHLDVPDMSNRHTYQYFVLSTNAGAERRLYDVRGYDNPAHSITLDPWDVQYGTDLFAGKPCMPGPCVNESGLNNATDTSYLSFLWSYSSGGAGYDTDTPHHLTDIVITSGADNGSGGCWAQWSDLHLSGSNDGSIWTVLTDWNDVPGCVSTHLSVPANIAGLTYRYFSLSTWAGAERRLYDLKGYDNYNGTPTPSTPIATTTAVATVTSITTATSTPTQTNAPLIDEVRCGGSPSEIGTTREAGFGVDTSTGYYCHEETDLAIPGRGVPLLFTRTYNSDVALAQASAGQSGPLGFGWTDNYNMYIDRDGAGGTSGNYRVHEENGSIITFASDFSAPQRVLATLQTSVGGELLFTRTHGQVRYYFHAQPGDSPGLLKLDRIQDRNNYITQLHYTGGKLTQVTDPAGRTLTLGYTGEMLTSVTDDTAGRHVTFDYDPSTNDLLTVHDVGSEPTLYTYYPNSPLSHLLNTITDANSHIANTTSYYDWGGVSSQHSDEGRSFSFSYTGSPGYYTTQVTEPTSMTTLYMYADYMLQEVTDHANTSTPAFTHYQYQAGTTWVSQVEDPLLHLWHTTWDNAGNALFTDDPSHHGSTYTYYPSNDLHTSTDRNNVATTYTYDGNGNLASTSRPLVETGETASTVYHHEDAQHPGDVSRTTDPRLKDWHATYDQYGYLKTASNPLGETTHTDYGNIGRLLSSTDAEGHTTQTDYNAYGEPLVVTNPLGYTTTYTYDHVGNVHMVTDAKQHTTTYTYNMDNQVLRVTHPDNSYIEYRYDGAGRVFSQTNELRQETVYTYDDANRRYNVRGPLPQGHTTEYAYDVAGRLDHVRNAEGHTTNYIYYDNSQLHIINYNDPATHNVTYTYNSRGMRDTMQDGSGTSTNQYDSLDHTTSVTDGNGHTVSYGYDLASNLTSIQYPESGDDHRRTFTRTFDNANRMQTLNGPDHGDPNTGSRLLATFGYDANGNLTSMTTPADVGVTRGFG